MAIFSLDNVAIRSVAAAVPAHQESNLDYTLLTEQERAFLIKTTGIEARRVAPDTITTSDLCLAAAQKILTSNNVSPTDIGLVIFVSQSNDYYLPATAATLQHRLGLPRQCMAFDVGLGCSGYVYGLTIAASLMRTCGIHKALLLAGDISTTTCAFEDKSTYPLFGDAGTATLLERTENATPWQGNLMTDGSKADAIIITDGMQRNKLCDSSFQIQDAGPGIRRAPLHLALKGDEVFAFSIREIPTSITTLLEQAETHVDSLDYFIMHQANKLMNETIRKKLKIPAEKTPYSLDQFGNTSSASIPLTMVTRLGKQLARPARLLLSGFGVGLSWGNLLIDSHSIGCLPLLEVE